MPLPQPMTVTNAVPMLAVPPACPGEVRTPWQPSRPARLPRQLVVSAVVEMPGEGIAAGLMARVAGAGGVGAHYQRVAQPTSGT